MTDQFEPAYRTADYMVRPGEAWLCPCGGGFGFTPRADQPACASVTVGCPHCGSSVETVAQ